jgi:uncharacterized membrane protein
VNKIKNERFWEIDLLRGIAIIMMIIFHILFDLVFLGIVKINLYSGLNLLFLYSIGTIFLLLVGVSLSLSYSRVMNALSKRQIWLKFIKRGIMIFCLGLIITFFTWFYLGRGFILFGVLHCIGLSIIFSILFLKHRFINLILGAILVFIGVFLKTMVFDFNWFLWLGFVPRGFYTVDYFPILPWFGVVLIGVFIGNILYKDNKRNFYIKDFSSVKFVKLFCFLGRYSLVIYFIHQPVIISLIYLFLLN